MLKAQEVKHGYPFKLACVATGLWLAAVNPCRAKQSESPDYVVEVWNTDTGLPNGTVTDIAQTPEGYLWVGTQLGGLARFDGVRFVAFHPGNTPELPSIEIQRLALDARGTLWIGVVEGGIVSYRQGQFQFERQSTLTPPAFFSAVVGCHGDEVVLSSQGGALWRRSYRGGTNRWEVFFAQDADARSSFTQDNHGVIWYRTRDGHLGQFDGKEFLRVPNNCGLSSTRVNALIADTGGRIWVGTDRELGTWDGQKFVNMTPTNAEPVLKVRQLSSSSDGQLWVATDTQLRKCADKSWTVQTEPGTGLLPLKGDMTLTADSRGGAWLISPRDGLWHVDGSGRVSRVGREEGLTGGTIKCWFEDREGNFWVGLANSGLVRVSRRVFQVLAPPTEAMDLATTSICQDGDGAMWIGTAAGRCFRWDGHEFADLGPAKKPSPNEVGTMVCPEGPDRVWVATVPGGIWIFETNGVRASFPATATPAGVRALYRDAVGQMWIGTSVGLHCWSNGVLRTFGPADGFTAAYVTSIVQDKSGAMFFGTAVGELRRWFYNRFTLFHPADFTNSLPSPLADEVVSGKPLGRGALSGGERFLALHADKEGVVWIGTLGGGLLRFANGKFARYGTREGLPSEHVSQILEDDRGQLWLGTRAGIARVSKEALNRFASGETTSIPWITYGKSDGLPSVECSSGTQPAAWRDFEGRLWFTTVKGVVSVRPDAIPTNPLAPPVVIEEARVEGELSGAPVAMAAAYGPGKTAPAIRVLAGRHYLEFHFAGLSFTVPDRVRFRWKLEGFDNDWIEGGTRRWTSYSFLPPGSYRFRVKACNSDGVWNEDGASLAVNVRPSFWQTWWFRAGATGLAIGLVAAGVRAITARKARRKLAEIERRHALERERARIAKDIHDDLGASLTHITMLSQSARLRPEASTQPGGELEQIYGTARELTRAMEEVVWAVSPRHDTLESLLAYITSYAQDFAAAAGVRCRWDLPQAFSHRPLSSPERHNAFLAFKEALHNVAKHAGATELKISLKLEPEAFVLVVEDNGHGFARHGENGSAGAPNGERLRHVQGFGMANMRSRMEEIGGSCEIQTRPGLGTSVRLLVPLSHK